MIQLEAFLVDDLLDQFGRDLRVVATYEDEDYELHFMRDDVREDYSEPEIAKVFDQIAIEGMGYQHFQKLFHVGELRCAMYGFEGATIFHFPTDTFDGLVVAIEQDVEFNPHELIQVCKEGVTTS